VAIWHLPQAIVNHEVRPGIAWNRRLCRAELAKQKQAMPALAIIVFEKFREWLWNFSPSLSSSPASSHSLFSQYVSVYCLSP
jgi:hypothetical protein